MKQSEKRKRNTSVANKVQKERTMTFHPGVYSFRDLVGHYVRMQNGDYADTWPHPLNPKTPAPALTVTPSKA